MTTVRPPVAGRGRTEDGGAGLAERLARLLDGSSSPADAAAEAPRLVTASVPVEGIDPISLLAAAVEADLEVALWLRPSEGTALVGIGRAWALELAGDARFLDAETAWQRLVTEAQVDRAAGATGGPTLLGGMGFAGRAPSPDDPWAPFGAASLVLPELLLSVADSRASLTAAVLRGTADDGAAMGDGHRVARALERRWDTLAERARDLAPSPGGMVARPVFAPLRVVGEQPGRELWERLVGMYAGAVGRGRLDKVVLARRLDLRSPVELDVANALRRLAASAPESTTFAFRRDRRTFLGATPERLVRTEGRAFRTVAVAGSIRRGADDAEDAALAADLLASDKDREEQAIVVAAIRDLLAPLAETLAVAPEPSVMTLRFVQHLVTEITGTLPEASGLLALAERLHPTPAVGGAPRETALAMIEEHEGFDRGWYAGPIGWLGADGDGELCVALRCGIVDRTRASLYAGCGIVADSDPDREWEESRIKLRAVVSALGHLEEPA